MGFDYQRMMMSITELMTIVMLFGLSADGYGYCSNTTQPACDHECCKQECCEGVCCNYDTCCNVQKVDTTLVVFGCAMVITGIGFGMYFIYRNRDNTHIARMLVRLGLTPRTDQAPPDNGQPAVYQSPVSSRNFTPTPHPPMGFNPVRQETPTNYTTFQTTGFAPPPEPPPPSYDEAIQSKI